MSQTAVNSTTSESVADSSIEPQPPKWDAQQQVPVGVPGYGPQQMPMMMGGQMGMGTIPIGGRMYPMGGPRYQMTPQIAVNPLPIPQTIPGVPTGLESLDLIDSVFVRQQIEVLEIVSGIHMPNIYDIFNVHGELIFRAIEHSNPNLVAISGARRDFNIIIYDTWGRQVLSLNRPWSLFNNESLTVCSPPGNKIGTVDPRGMCNTEFLLRNATGEIVLKIEGLGGGGACFNWGTINFRILSVNSLTTVGNITKQSAGFVQESISSADNFVISFPKDLDICVKATLVGACVLLDFMYFEYVQNNHHRGGYGGYGGYGFGHHRHHLF